MSFGRARWCGSRTAPSRNSRIAPTGSRSNCWRRRPGRFDGDAVDVDDRVGSYRRHTRAGNDETDEIARVGGIHGYSLAGTFGLADRVELLDRLGQRVLLAGEAGNESAAAHETAVFEPAQRALHVAPGEPDGFSLPQVAEQHAPPPQQHLG